MSKTRKYDAAYLEKLRTLLAEPKRNGYAWLNCGPGKVVVDIGCGLGADAAELAKSGAHVIGIDRNEEWLADAQLRYGSTVEFRVGDAAATSCDAASVDAVRFDRVLQHIADHEAVLNEVVRVLKQGGLLQITDTDILSLSYFMDDVALERKISDIMASRFSGSLSLRLLPEKMKACGFEALRISVHQICVYGFEEAEYLIGVDEVLRVDGAAYGFTEDELRTWDAWKASGRCYLTMNLVTLQAAKI